MTVFFRSGALMNNYTFVATDYSYVGESEVFLDDQTMSFYVNARLRFIAIFVKSSRGVEVGCGTYCFHASHIPARNV